MSTLFTRKQAAELLGISLTTLDAERTAGRIAYIQRKPGGKVWITETALEEYLARGTHQAHPEREQRPTLRKQRTTIKEATA